jgi:hypothetical protein|tara:strand:+ start:2143 stop:3012 length:870 start_codon:yes stop_codon:yes gene_type:complete
MDVLIFSKDRAFQLYSALETLIQYTEGINNIYVQFSHSKKEFLDGYKKINKYFSNVTFIDENEYGFNDTLLTILHQEISTENLFLEVDDNLYFDKLNLLELEKKFNESNASKLGVGFDINLFDTKYYTIKNNIAIVDKSITIDNKIQDICLKYPFNVSGAIHRLEDLKKLLTVEKVINPIDLEIKGSSSYIFSNYPYNLYNIKEVCRQIHTNNFGKRYEEVFDVETLNNFLINGEVLDLSSTKLGEYTPDMRWFNGENIGRFPIFPWEIPPSYHSEIINNRKKINDFPQ